VKYLNGIGNNSFLPDSPKAKSDYIPYIYSDEELLLLIYYADNLKVMAPKACSPYLMAKIPMILRILYGCGTRLGETMALKRKDIDFKARTIFLRETKFSKERRIPVHETLITIMERYCLTIGIMLSPEAYLFPGDKQDSHYTTRQVATWFSELLRLANIDQREKKSGERGASLHCLRHVFVLKSMQQLEAAGHSVDMNDLLLPTYLGHECLLDTDKYMRFSGAQIPESLDAFEIFTAGLIPQVEVPYEDE
jgi:integrase